MPCHLWGSPTFPYSCRTLAIRLHGFHRRTTTLGRLRRDLCVRRPPHKNGTFYPHYLRCHSGTGCPIILSTRVEAPRPPRRHRLRSKPPVCLSLHPTLTQTARRQEQLIHSISPPIGWTNGMSKSDVGTIFTDLL